MIDFEADLSTPTRRQRVAAPVVTQQVTVTPVAPAAFKARAEEEWGWSDLRDYVMSQIEKSHGPQVRDPRKESGIFKSFMSRYTATQAIAIAKYAFEVSDGWWHNAPISVNRFCRNSDQYFGDVILERI